MKQISGTYRDGIVQLDEPVEWPSETTVQVTVQSDPESEELCMDGSPWPRTPEEIDNWLTWFDSLEPVLTDLEYERFEKMRLEEKAKQKELARLEGGKLASLFKT